MQQNEKAAFHKVFHRIPTERDIAFFAALVEIGKEAMARYMTPGQIGQCFSFAAMAFHGIEKKAQSDLASRKKN